MKKMASQHTFAMATGLLHQKRCGEPDAGPYCIAESSGFGRVAEFLAWFLPILYGVYASTIAIESPGGDDDQQWLTFWVMFVASMLLERNFARVILSRFPFYYQFKLVFIVWLMFFDGAAIVYRWVRRRIFQWSPLFKGVIYSRSHSTAQNKLNTMIRIGGTLITDQIALLERGLRRNFKKRNSSLFSYSPETESFWEYDYTDTKREMKETSALADEERLHQISKWILSSEGLQKIDDTLNSTTGALLLEHAATEISFQPKFLNIHLIGTKPGAEGKLPVMDPNGKADCYVKFSLVSDKETSLENCTAIQQNGSSDENSYINLTEMMKRRYFNNNTAVSRIAYRTLEPEWNQILEVPIGGGILDEDGTYRNNGLKDTILLVEAWDADCGKWGIAFEVFRVLNCAFICVLVVAYVIGAIDFVFNESLSTEQWWLKTTTIVLTPSVAVGMLLSWMMSVVLGADDEFIGKCAVPLEILTDRREHSLALKLRKMRTARGILRAKLRLSEN